MYIPYDNVFHTCDRTAEPAAFRSSFDGEPDRERDNMESLSSQSEPFLIRRRGEERMLAVVVRRKEWQLMRIVVEDMSRRGVQVF